MARIDLVRLLPRAAATAAAAAAAETLFVSRHREEGVSVEAFPTDTRGRMSGKTL